MDGRHVDGRARARWCCGLSFRVHLHFPSGLLATQIVNIHTVFVIPGLPGSPLDSHLVIPGTREGGKTIGRRLFQVPPTLC